jgi:uncharacterized damage-inducible protein DinB
MEDSMKRVALFAAFCAAALPLCAQESGANPLTDASKAFYMMVNQNVIKAAEEMPENYYSFRPAPTVRSFGQLVAHVADGQYEFCSAVIGDRTRGPQVEKNVTGKDNLITALKQAFKYCDKAYDGMNDTRGVQTVQFFGRTVPRISLLDFNTAHTDEHYGNMVTYMRIKGLVPPSSQRQSR